MGYLSRGACMLSNHGHIAGNNWCLIRKMQRTHRVPVQNSPILSIHQQWTSTYNNIITKICLLWTNVDANSKCKSFSIDNVCMAAGDWYCSWTRPTKN